MSFGIKSVTGATVFPLEENPAGSSENAIVELVYDEKTHKLTAKRANGEEFVVFQAVPHSQNS